MRYEYDEFKSKFDETFFHEERFVLPQDTKGRELIKDYKIMNYSLRSHPIKLLRPFLEKLP